MLFSRFITFKAVTNIISNTKKPCIEVKLRKKFISSVIIEGDSIIIVCDGKNIIVDKIQDSLLPNKFYTYEFDKLKSKLNKI